MSLKDTLRNSILSAADELLKKAEELKRANAENNAVLQESINLENKQAQSAENVNKEKSSRKTISQQILDVEKQIKNATSEEVLQLEKLKQGLRDLAAQTKKRASEELNAQNAQKQSIANLNAQITKAKELLETYKKQTAATQGKVSAGAGTFVQQGDLATNNNLMKEYNKIIAETSQLSKELAQSEQTWGATQSDALAKAQEQMSSLSALDAQMEEVLKQQNALNLSGEQYENVMDARAKTTINMTAQEEQFTASINNENKVLNDNLQRIYANAEGSKRLQAAKASLAYATTQEATDIQILKQQEKELMAVRKLEATLIYSQESSYEQLNKAYMQLRTQIDTVSYSERENNLVWKEKIRLAESLKKKMMAMQTQTGDYSMVAGDYKNAMNTMNMATSQLVRELPALSISADMFFLAISNNIPMLVDAVNKMKRTGATFTQTIGAMIKSLISWNTIIMLATTLLTVYGRDIVNFIGRLFDGTLALSAAENALRELNQAFIEGEKDAQNEIQKLNLLFDVLMDLEQPMDKRAKALALIQKNYDNGYIDNITLEAMETAKAATAYNDLSTNILRAAYAQAVFDKIVENNKTMLDLRDKIIEKSGYPVLIERLRAYSPQEFLLYVKDQMYHAPFNKPARRYRKYAKAHDENETLLEYLKLGDWESLFTKTTEGSGGGTQQDNLLALQKQLALYKNIIKNAGNDLKTELGKIGIEQIFDIEEMQKKLNDANTPEVEKGIIQQIIDLIPSIKELERQGAKDKINESIKGIFDDLDDAIKEAKIETMKGDGSIFSEIFLASDKEIAAINKKYDDAIIGIKNQADKDKQLLQNMSEEQKKLYKEKVDFLINLQNEIRRMEIQKREQERDTELLNTIETELADTYKEQLNNKKELISQQKKARQYDDSLTQADKEKANLQDEIDLVEEQIRLLKEQIALRSKYYSMDVTNAAVDASLAASNDAAVEQINKLLIYISILQEKLAKLGESGATEETKFDWRSLKQGLSTWANETIGYISEVIDAYREMADAKVEAAQIGVKAAEDALEREKLAAANGYASNIIMAKRELDLQKKREEQSLAIQTQAQRAQAKLDTLSQISSLTTASASIYESLSGLGPAGIALAVAAIASMFTSFLWAKAKAAELSGTTTYGSGGFEVLEGGSHASGNDIPLGITSDGKQRRAEGKEGLAIFSKAAMRKYGSDIPTLVNAINNGNMQNTLSSSLSSGNIMPIIISTNLSTLEYEVSRIRIAAENKSQTYIDSKGRVVTKYKNLTEIKN